MGVKTRLNMDSKEVKSSLEAVLKVKVYRVVHRFTLMFTDFYQNFDNISDNLCPSVDPGRLLKQSLSKH